MRPIASQLKTTSAQVLDGFVIRTASAFTRRQFLRNAGTVALGAALSAALIGTEFSGVALATGTCASPCGPSPLCDGANCNGSGQCGTGTPNCQNRPYNSGNCGSGNNCWTEPYCPGCAQNHGSFRCCDCCCPNAPQSGGSCTGCSGGSTKWKCICRSHTCLTCPC